MIGMNATKLWEGVIRFCWVALIVLSAIGVTLIFTPKCRTLRELQRKKAAIEQENQRTEAAILDLQMRQHQFKTDPAFVERTAHEIGMVKSNEAMFRISKEQPHADNTRR